MSDSNSNNVIATESKEDRKKRLKREAAKRRRDAAKQTTQAEPKPTGAIAERAMLANQCISVWEGRKKDKTISDEVLTDATAQKDAGAWWTRTVPQSALKAIGLAVHHARKAHWESTLPWSDAGPRVLPASMFFEYTSKMQKAKAEFDAAVEGFLVEYPKLVAEAPARLGKLMTDVEFPSVDQLRSKFSFSTQITPLPSAGDFRVDLGADRTNDIREQIEAQSNASMARAMGDLWTRLHAAVDKIATRLSDDEAVFRDSLIENLVDLCELLPKMNVTQDQNLDAMRDEVLSKLSKQDPEVLRKNKPARADAAKAANEIAEKMKAFMGAK